jgi:hypothetical protein
MITERNAGTGAPKGRRGKFVGAWIPSTTAEQLDELVDRLDLDRSKFLRRALAEKLERHSSAGPARGGGEMK